LGSAGEDEKREARLRRQQSWPCKEAEWAQNNINYMSTPAKRHRGMVNDTLGSHAEILIPEQT